MIIIDKYKSELETYKGKETFNIRIDEIDVYSYSKTHIAQAYLTLDDVKKLKLELHRFIANAE